MKTMKEIYEAIQSGDSVTTEECEVGCSFFYKLATDLFSIGPHFRLAGKEALYAANTLDMYLTARNRAKRA